MYLCLSRLQSNYLESTNCTFCICSLIYKLILLLSVVLPHFLVELWTLKALGLSDLSFAGGVSMNCKQARFHSTKIHVDTDYEALVACLECTVLVFEFGQYMNFQMEEQKKFQLNKSKYTSCLVMNGGWCSHNKFFRPVLSCLYILSGQLIGILPSLIINSCINFSDILGREIILLRIYVNLYKNILHAKWSWKP